MLQELGWLLDSTQQAIRSAALSMMSCWREELCSKVAGPSAGPATMAALVVGLAN